MTSIGVRCSTVKCWYVVAEGTRSKPTLVVADVLNCPKDVTRPFFFDWLRKEIKTLVAAHKATAARFKSMEFAPKIPKAWLERAEVEGVVQQAFQEAGCRTIEGVTKSQIKAAIHFKGAIANVVEALSSTAFKDLSSAELQEAALAAWSGLPE